MKIDLESRVLLSLISKTSFNKDVPFLQDNEKIEDINWRKVFEESIIQTVIFYAFCAVTPYKNHVPADVFEKWFSLSRRVLASNAVIINRQNELTEFLDKSNYRYIILKGLSSAEYYENPDMRMLGDIDFLIERNKTDEIAQKIREQLNYQNSVDIDHICHVTMAKGNTSIEMHFDIPGIPNNKNGEAIRQHIIHILEDTQHIKQAECEFTAPSHLNHGIIILLHTLHHLTGDGLGLRHLCDWGAFVNNTSKIDFWKDEFVPFLKEIKLFKFACVMSSVCKKYMGIDMPESLDFIDDEICDEIMCEILKSGNFGQKDDKFHDSGMIASENSKGNTNKSNLVIMLERLDSAVKSHWPMLNKWKILLPFAYIFFVLRYYFKVLKGERPTISSLIPEANRRKELYKKLEIYEDTK